MGAYDSIYARCNCDWPDDDRCKNLPDDQTRWFNHLLWLESVRQKSSVLPQRCDAAHWAKRLGASIERVEEMIKAMATEDLLGWTEHGELVIFGTRKNHPKLAWKEDEPAEILNPFKKTSGWRFLRLSGEKVGYPVKQETYPVKSPTVESRVEKSREEESRSHAQARDHHDPPLEPEQFELEGSQEHKPPSKQDVVGAWNVLASKKSWPRVSKIPGGKLGTTLEARVKDDWWLEHFPKALAKLEAISWLETYTFERFLYADAVRKIVDGDWDDRAPRGRANVGAGRIDFGPPTEKEQARNDEVYASINRQSDALKAKFREQAAARKAAEGAIQ